MALRPVLRSVFALAAATLVSSARAGDERIRVGVLPGPDARVMSVVRDVVAKRGLSIEIVVMRDAARLDAALSAGTLDANSCQDLATLEADVEAQGHALVAAGHTITLPLALYSKKVRSLRELKEGDTIALPRARADAARALLLLHNYGVIRLRDGAGLGARIADVTANPRGLNLVAVDTRRLAGSLGTHTAVAMTYEVAGAAGLEPARDSVAMEDGRSPYAHVLATRRRDAGKPWVAALLAACHSDAVRDFILTEFHDSVRRPW